MKNVIPLSLAASSLHAARRALEWAEKAGAGPYTLEAMRHEVERAQEALEAQPDPMDAIVRRFAEEAL